MECRTVKQAAERVGIGKGTLGGWTQIPEFHEAYGETRRECVDRALARLEKGFEFAIAVLQRIAGDGGALSYARVAAARGLIDLSSKAIEMHDVAERVRRIKERLLWEQIPSKRLAMSPAFSNGS